MTDESLEQLLRAADAEMASGDLKFGLAGRVRQRAKRRSARRLAGAAIVAALVCGSAAMWVASGRQHIASHIRVSPTTAPNRAPAPPIDAARLRREYAEYEAEARQHQQASRRWRLIEQRSAEHVRIARLLVEPDPMDELLEQRNRTAQTLVDYGDSISREPWGRAAADAAYRQVTKLFPDTAPGAVARERLRHSRA
jgi:hypothetical protein